MNYAYSSREKRIYATLSGRGCEHLKQLASPNLDSDGQKSVFYFVETLYITVVSFRRMGQYYYAVAK